MLDNYSSMLTSLNAHQTRLDIIANNIANINSVGYKKSTVSFGDALYKAMNTPGMPVSQKVRCGTGTVVSGTEKNFTEGMLMNTGREYDFAVDGKGFFGVILQDGSYAYTRDGNFHLDGEQNLVNAQGYRVYTDMVLPEGCTSISVDSTGEVSGVLSDGTVSVIGSIPLFEVPNEAGMKALGNGLYQETGASGSVSQGSGDSEGFGVIKQRYLEMSNVDLGEELVDLIIAQKSFQFSAQTIRTLDDMWGVANNLQR